MRTNSISAPETKEFSPKIIFKEKSKVVNIILTHCNSFKTDTESKARIYFRINTAVCKYLRVYHTAAQNFNPALAFTYAAAFTAASETRNVNFG